MLWLRSCPRCENGDMYLDGDENRHYMQCGYVQESTSQTGASARLALALTLPGPRYRVSLAYTYFRISVVR